MSYSISDRECRSTRGTFADESRRVVSYWEGFSVHAFENTTQHFFMRSVIMLPDQKPLSCTCCFTIRRDVFDLVSDQL
jgi:hypothetical protein